jgi:hypothetical protein
MSEWVGESLRKKERKKEERKKERNIMDFQHLGNGFK